MTPPLDTIALFPLSATVAWRRYLEATQGLDGDAYDLAERAAWEQLQVSLVRVRGSSRPLDAA